MVSLFTLLKNDLNVLGYFLIVPIAIAFMEITFAPSGDEIDHIMPVGIILSSMMPVVLFKFMFHMGGLRLKEQPGQHLGDLEFMFSRAINRSLQFASRSSIFLMSACLAPLLILVFSYYSPLTRIDLPTYNEFETQNLKQFYSSHFPDAYVGQDTDGKRNKVFVILPRGRVDEAINSCLFTMAITLLVEAVLFAASESPLISFVITLVVMAGIPLASLFEITGDEPSLYELSLGFSSQHLLLVLGGVILLFVLTQLYCCRRFIATEITS